MREKAASKWRREEFLLLGHCVRVHSLPHSRGRAQHADKLCPARRLRSLPLFLRLLALLDVGFGVLCKGVTTFLPLPGNARCHMRALPFDGAGLIAVLALIKPVRCPAVGDAVGELMVMSCMMSVTVATPWGLHPIAGPSCDAAAASCWGASAGDAGTVPPPRFLLVGRVTRVRLRSATRRLHPPQVFGGRDQRISVSLP